MLVYLVLSVLRGWQEARPRAQGREETHATRATILLAAKLTQKCAFVDNSARGEGTWASCTSVHFGCCTVWLRVGTFPQFLLRTWLQVICRRSILNIQRASSHLPRNMVHQEKNNRQRSFSQKAPEQSLSRRPVLHLQPGELASVAWPDTKAARFVAHRSSSQLSCGFALERPNSLIIFSSQNSLLHRCVSVSDGLCPSCHCLVTLQKC